MSAANHTDSYDGEEVEAEERERVTVSKGGRENKSAREQEKESELFLVPWLSGFLLHLMFRSNIFSGTLGGCWRKMCCVDQGSHCGAAGAALMAFGLRLDSVIDLLPRVLPLPLAKATRTQSVEELEVDSGLPEEETWPSSSGGLHAEVREVLKPSTMESSCALSSKP